MLWLLPFAAPSCLSNEMVGWVFYEQLIKFDCDAPFRYAVALSDCQTCKRLLGLSRFIEFRFVSECVASCFNLAPLALLGSGGVWALSLFPDAFRVARVP